MLGDGTLEFAGHFGVSTAVDPGHAVSLVGECECRGPADAGATSSDQRPPPGETRLEGHLAVQPPSITWDVPVIDAADGPHRKRT